MPETLAEMAARLGVSLTVPPAGQDEPAPSTPVAPQRPASGTVPDGRRTAGRAQPPQRSANAEAAQRRTDRTQARILNALHAASGPLTVRQIAEATGMSVSGVFNQLVKLTEDRVLERVCGYTIREDL